MPRRAARVPLFSYFILTKPTEDWHTKQKRRKRWTREEQDLHVVTKSSILAEENSALGWACCQETRLVSRENSDSASTFRDFRMD